MAEPGFESRQWLQRLFYPLFHYLPILFTRQIGIVYLLRDRTVLGSQQGYKDGSTHPSNPEYEESGDSNSSGGSELEPSGHQLFCLEYEADSGEVTSVIVYQDDDPGRVSEEVSAHTPLDPPMREALKLRVQEEIAKRRNRH
ncbi:UPF0561 protein C2orf68 homolog isoform 2-T3 [Trichechus inunguis]